MEPLTQLKQYGLFDDKVPRYTSYPPANHFSPDAGLKHQQYWLSKVQKGASVSLYVHIPFCKRLCWFCACRTQGTQTLGPVDSYVQTLIREIAFVRAQMPENIKMSRLHLGGGTPTLLSPQTMSSLLDTLYDAFAPAPNFEFSVEIDPTEASPDLLETLAGYKMNRASIGIQDFAPQVQEAIGRLQTPEQTRQAIEILRRRTLNSLNVDLLYGLPYQTQASLGDTLNQVLDLTPDRIALYGYAHVPWMSKRQVMIDASKLPDSQARFDLAEYARERLLAAGYVAVGIDHFALPSDSLAQALRDKTLRRNFQGYTDDTADTLIGLGASAISRFPQGYSQNAAATSVYLRRIAESQKAGLRGYVMSDLETLAARMIEQLMCFFYIDTNPLIQAYPQRKALINKSLSDLAQSFPKVSCFENGVYRVEPWAHPLARIIAKELDGFSSQGQAHSMAI